MNSSRFNAHGRALLAATMLLAGCQSNVTLHKRYTAIDCADTNCASQQHKLVVSGFAISSPSKSAPSLADLPVEGLKASVVGLTRILLQTQRLNHTATNAPKAPSPSAAGAPPPGGAPPVAANTSPDLAGKLAEFLQTELASESIVDNRTTIKKRLVLSLEDQGYVPADRIAKVTFQVVLPPGLKVAGIDRIASETAAIDYGSVKLTTTNETTFTAQATFAGNAVTPFVNKSGRTAVEDLVLKGEIEKFTAIPLNPLDKSECARLRITRHGAPLSDLTGNVVIDMTLVGVEEISDAYTASLEPLTKGEFKLSVKPTRLIDLDGKPHCQTPRAKSTATSENLMSGVSANYIVRRVVEGAERYVEGDQKIRFDEGVTEFSPFEILTAQDQSRITGKGFCPVMLTDKKLPKQLYLRARDVDQNIVPLAFDSFNQAETIVENLRGKRRILDANNSDVLLGTVNTDGTALDPLPAFVEFGVRSECTRREFHFSSSPPKASDSSGSKPTSATDATKNRTPLNFQMR